MNMNFKTWKSNIILMIVGWNSVWKTQNFYVINLI